jgi:hypothetical protein
MLFKITYEGQVVSDSLNLDEATQLKEELNEEAEADGCEALYEVEQQSSLEVVS